VGPAGGLLHSAPFDAHPQQHSGHQQMRAVPYCQPTYEAEHRLVIKVLSITGKWLIFGEVMCKSLVSCCFDWRCRKQSCSAVEADDVEDVINDTTSSAVTPSDQDSRSDDTVDDRRKPRRSQCGNISYHFVELFWLHCYTYARFYQHGINLGLAMRSLASYSENKLRAFYILQLCSDYVIGE